jgi:hypothetical protein
MVGDGRVRRWRLQTEYKGQIVWKEGGDASLEDARLRLVKKRRSEIQGESTSRIVTYCLWPLQHIFANICSIGQMFSVRCQPK